MAKASTAVDRDRFNAARPRGEARAQDDSALVDAQYLASQWGESENHRRAKYYKLTAVGRREVDAELTNWQRIVTAIGWPIKATS